MQEYVYSVHRILIEINLRIEHVLSKLTYIRKAIVRSKSEKNHAKNLS